MSFYDLYNYIKMPVLSYFSLPNIFDNNINKTTV